MSPVEFEPTISAGERPQTYALDRAATGTGSGPIYEGIFTDICSCFLALSFLRNVCNHYPATQLHISERLISQTPVILLPFSVHSITFTGHSHVR